MDTNQIAEIINKNIGIIPSVEAYSGNRITVTSAAAKSPHGKGGPVRVYLGIESDNPRGAPQKVWIDGDGLHYQYGLACVSPQARFDIDMAMYELEESILQIVRQAKAA